MRGLKLFIHALRHFSFKRLHKYSFKIIISKLFELLKVNLILGQNPQVYKMGWLVKQVLYKKFKSIKKQIRRMNFGSLYLQH